MIEKEKIGKVLFGISVSHVKAGGGHLYSLNILLEELGDSINAKAVNTEMGSVSTISKNNLLKVFWERCYSPLLVLGEIQDNSSCEELKAKGEDLPIRFVADKKYMRNAVLEGSGGIVSFMLNSLLFFHS